MTVPPTPPMSKDNDKKRWTLTSAVSALSSLMLTQPSCMPEKLNLPPWIEPDMHTTSSWQSPLTLRNQGALAWP